MNDEYKEMYEEIADFMHVSLGIDLTCVDSPRDPVFLHEDIMERIIRLHVENVAMKKRLQEVEGLWAQAEARRVRANVAQRSRERQYALQAVPGRDPREV
jgi:hypothetical protein